VRRKLTYCAKISVFTVLLLAAIFLVPATGLGQAAERELPDLAFHLAGEQVPRYYLALHFFRLAYFALEHNSDTRAALLQALKIEENSTAEQALHKALIRAHQLETGESKVSTSYTTESGRQTTVVIGSAEPKVAPSDFASDAEYMSFINSKEIAQAEALALIYRDLEADMANAGASMVGIERYIHDQIAPSTSMASDKPLNSDNPTWKVGEAFERRLTELSQRR
jgi:hypothetical protein